MFSNFSSTELAQMEPKILFQKELRRNDISNQFTFPTLSLAAFGFAPGVHKTDFQAFDADNVPWKFRLTTRSGRYTKPVILKSSWHPFVVGKKLVEGDRVTIFTEETVNGMRFHVRAERKLIKALADGDDKEAYVEVERLRNTVGPVSVRW